MENEVKILRLVTGEDIICNYYKISSDSYIVSDPMVLMINFKGKNPNVIMEHWLPVEVIKKNQVLINPRDIITIIEPNESISEYYSNLVIKVHKSLEMKKNLESIDEEDYEEIMEALKQSRGNILH